MTSTATPCETRLDEDRAGILLSIHGARPYSDMVLRAMQWTEALLESRQSERSDMLASALADLCSASGAWVADSVTEARQFEAGRYALERGAPVAHRTDSIPVGIAPDLGEGAWLLAVPDHETEPLRVAFLARPLRLRFTATEIARVVALLRTCRTLDQQSWRARRSAPSPKSEPAPPRRVVRSASAGSCSLHSSTIGAARTRRRTAPPVTPRRRRPLRFRRLLLAALDNRCCAHPAARCAARQIACRRLPTSAHLSS